MRIKNEMTALQHNVDFTTEIVTEQLARFRFDLVKHPELRDPALVKRCMTEYVGDVNYKTTGWAGKIDGNTLIIDVNGQVNEWAYKPATD